MVTDEDKAAVRRVLDALQAFNEATVDARRLGLYLEFQEAREFGGGGRLVLSVSERRDRVLP